MTVRELIIALQELCPMREDCQVVLFEADGALEFDVIGVEPEEFRSCVEIIYRGV